MATNPILDSDGAYIGALAMVTDISESLAAREKLESSLQEKEVLLREVYHRVKNNMQMVVSLLKLQAQRAADERVTSILDDSQSRLLAMSAVHEQLYASDDLAHIRFSGYLRSLLANLWPARDPRNGSVELTTDLEDVEIGVDQAVPLGLLANELLTNAFKYAFPGGGAGAVSVSLRLLPRETIELVIADNGAGLPENVDWRKPETLGLHLVNGLVKQLQGDITLDRRRGTRFCVRFRRTR